MMNRYTKVLAASLFFACAAQVALAAGSPGVEHHAQGFLDALAAGGGLNGAVSAIVGSKTNQRILLSRMAASGRLIRSE
jgi:hypothetical protein